MTYLENTTAGSNLSYWVELGEKILNWLPNLLVALGILILGWMVASGVGLLLINLLKVSGLQKFFEKVGIDYNLKKINIGVESSVLLGRIVKWVLLIIVFLIVIYQLGLTQVATFLKDLIGYLPNIVAAVLVLIIGFTVAFFVEQAIVSVFKKSRAVAVSFAARAGKSAIYLFTIIAALVQLKVAASVLQMLLAGLIAMIAIGGGLAIGLGGKDVAKRLLEKLEKEFLEK